MPADSASISSRYRLNSSKLTALSTVTTMFGVAPCWKNFAL